MSKRRRRAYRGSPDKGYWRGAKNPSPADACGTISRRLIWRSIERESQMHLSADEAPAGLVRLGPRLFRIRTVDAIALDLSARPIVE
jgi:hypothetical protein